MNKKDRLYKLKKITLPTWKFKLFLFKEWLKRIYNKLNNMFYWCGIYLFNTRLYKYGGFNHFIAGKIFKWKYSYMFISITYNIRFKNQYKDEDTYYDGYHNSLHIGFIRIDYGT